MNRLFLLLILLFPLTAAAQRWQVGLSAGASVNTAPIDFSFYQDSRISPAPALMLSVSRRITPGLEAGIDVSATALKRVADVVIYQNGHPLGTASDARVHFGNAAFSITPSLSFLLGGFYLGPQLGYLTTTDGNDDFSGSHAHIYYNHYSGFCAGAHAGYAAPLAKNVLLSAELRANYIVGTLTDKGYKTQANMVQAGVLVGLKYRF